MLEVIHCDSRYTEVKGWAVMFHGSEGFRGATNTKHHLRKGRDNTEGKYIEAM